MHYQYTVLEVVHAALNYGAMSVVLSHGCNRRGYGSFSDTPEKSQRR